MAAPEAYIFIRYCGAWTFRCELTDHSWGSPAHVHWFDRVLYTFHLLLMATSLAGSVLLCLFQGCLQGFDPLSCGSQSLFHFGNFTPEVSIIPQQLWSRTWTWTVVKTGDGTWKCEQWLLTCLWAFPSCSRLFSKKLIFCLWLLLSSAFAESMWEFCKDHPGSLAHSVHLHNLLASYHWWGQLDSG